MAKLGINYVYIFGLLFCQASVNSHHPIGGKNFRLRSLFLWRGYIESENCFETNKGSTIE